MMRFQHAFTILLTCLVFCCSKSELTEPENDTIPPPLSTGGNIKPSSPESNPESSDTTGTTYYILFVGNSLTYTNNLPEKVENVAKNKGMNVVTHMVAYPNYALEDHWNDGIEQVIRNGNYDYVVVQQGPSSQEDGRTSLQEFGGKFSAVCKQVNTQLAFFMVWPSRTYYFTFNGVIANYSEAATKTGAILCPVGSRWKSHFEKTGNYSFYGSDGFHPSIYGTRNAAEIIVETLFKQKPITKG